MPHNSNFHEHEFLFQRLQFTGVAPEILNVFPPSIQHCLCNHSDELWNRANRSMWSGPWIRLMSKTLGRKTIKHTVSCYSKLHFKFYITFLPPHPVYAKHTWASACCFLPTCRTTPFNAWWAHALGMIVDKSTGHLFKQRGEGNVIESKPCILTLPLEQMPGAVTDSLQTTHSISRNSSIRCEWKNKNKYIHKVCKQLFSQRYGFWESMIGCRWLGGKYGFAK